MFSPHAGVPLVLKRQIIAQVSFPAQQLMVHPRKHARSTRLRVRRLNYHLRHWGPEDAPKLFMFHGWMDVGASFQFVVDSLARDWHVIAPDWRGYGMTQWPDADCYWFPDYLGDLDAILEALSPGEAVNLVGHSLGGNVVMLYAGVRPERVARLVNLEGFGLPGHQTDEAPARYAKWLGELRDPPTLKPYPSHQAVAERLRKTNPHLTEERAAFLADHWATEEKGEHGAEWRILGDPAHKLINPVLYRVDEVMACWRGIAAPVLWVNGADSKIYRNMLKLPGFDERLKNIRDLRVVTIEGAGHMVHHDQPEQVAALIEDFLNSGSE